MKINETKKIEIVKEAIGNGNIKEVSKKHSVGLSTLYRWISKYSDKGNSNQIYYVSVSFNEEEYMKFNSLLEQYGYKYSRIYFIKNTLFNKTMPPIHAKKLIAELFKIKAELNKIGSNLNQIANYYNYLAKNNILNEKKIDTLSNEINEIHQTWLDFKDVLSKVFKKEF